MDDVLTHLRQGIETREREADKLRIVYEYAAGSPGRFLRLMGTCEADGPFHAGDCDEECFCNELDGEGDNVSSEWVEGLGLFASCVRIFVNRGTRREDAVRLLRKAADKLANEPDDVLECPPFAPVTGVCG